MKFSITVPSKVGSSAPIGAEFDHDKVVNGVMAQLSSICGGATALVGFGAWLDAKGKLVTENVTVVYTFGEPEKEEAVKSLALQLAAEAWQDCVLLEVDGVPHFIECEVRHWKNDKGNLCSQYNEGGEIRKLELFLNKHDLKTGFITSQLGDGIITYISFETENGVLEKIDYSPKESEDNPADYITPQVFELIKAAGFDIKQSKALHEGLERIEEMLLSAI